MRVRSALCSGLAAIGLSFGLSTNPALAFVTVSVTPTNQVVLAGNTAILNAQVTKTAGETITGYVWQMSTNGLSPFKTVPGATTATCTLTNVQPTADGYYISRVIYSSGTNVGLESVSAAVRLVIPDRARIVTQPQDVALLFPTNGTSIPTNVSFTVGALGAQPLGYQWRFNGTNLVDTPPHLNGATTATLTLTDLTLADSGNYDVVVTNVAVFTNLPSVVYTNYAATSQVAILGIYIPPGIAVQPFDTQWVIGSNATFSVTPSGTPPFGYAWRKNGTNLSNGGQISGATSDSLTIAAVTTNDVGSYSVLVTNPVGSVVSSNAMLTLLFPATFTSPTNAVGRQGGVFNFTNTATGTLPITFGATNLPLGLSLEPTNGIISGIPVVTGVVSVTLFATNYTVSQFATNPVTTRTQLVVTLTTGAPGITGPVVASGRQGVSFYYPLPVSNTPAVFTIPGLPAGLNIIQTNGTITGVPWVSGDFSLPLGVTNAYGGDSNLLTLTLASAVPVITSSLFAFGSENQSGFSYTIRASNSPTEFGASDLPLGLTVNTNTGVISGTPLYGGTFTVPIWAINAWGTGRANLILYVFYAPIGGLAIRDVIATYSSPYLLDFSFSLVDDSDPDSLNPVVRPSSQLQVTCMEDGVPITSETAFVVESVKANTKQLKSFIVLDYTYSMYAVAGAIDAMELAAKTFISSEPEHALFGIYEFHADYEDPNLVTTNGFISDKGALSQYIDSIEDTYVQGNYAGTRCWDAVYAALEEFGDPIPDEQRYLVVMSDGNDDSSVLPDPVNAIVALAQEKQVRIYAVAFGDDINTAALEQLTSETMGQYYVAATTPDLPLQFSKIAKNIDGQYILRWATLKRAAVSFQPSFEVTVEGLSDDYSTESADYNPTEHAGDVKVGGLRLVADGMVGPQTIRLRATYVPRYVRALRFSYRPNYACTNSLASANAGEILYGWNMTETNDGTGLRIVTLLSPNPTNLATSITYGALGDLVDFQFTYPDSVMATQAFSVFTIDNTIYTNMLPGGQSFVLSNASSFITVYPEPPPYGTPIPWLRSYGFTSNYEAAELSDPNGNRMAVWQEYIAGLDPLDTNSTLNVWPAFTAGETPQILFRTVATRTYRVEAATTLLTNSFTNSPSNWVLIRDGITGTGGDILFIDNRNLSSVNAVYYRVGVY